MKPTGFIGAIPVKDTIAVKLRYRDIGVHDPVCVVTSRRGVRRDRRAPRPWATYCLGPGPRTSIGADVILVRPTRLSRALG